MATRKKGYGWIRTPPPPPGGGAGPPHGERPIVAYETAPAEEAHREPGEEIGVPAPQEIVDDEPPPPDPVQGAEQPDPPDPPPSGPRPAAASGDSCRPPRSGPAVPAGGPIEQWPPGCRRRRSPRPGSGSRRLAPDAASGRGRPGSAGRP